jgi:hypothetical protein
MNAVISGALASSDVGVASSARLIQMPRRRSRLRLDNATTTPAMAMPIVLAFTATPIMTGVVW